MILRANAVDVGPKIYSYSKNFIVMELVKGIGIREYILTSDKNLLAPVIKDLLRQCISLDLAGLDHGELSRADKHVYIVDDQPIIIDFDSASVTRKPKNLSSILSYLVFKNTEVTYKIRKLFKINIHGLRQLLREYKHGCNVKKIYGSIVGLFDK